MLRVQEFPVEQLVGRSLRIDFWIWSDAFGEKKEYSA